MGVTQVSGLKKQGRSLFGLLIIVNCCLQLALLPDAFYNLVVYLQLALPVLQAFYPSASEDLAIAEEKSPSTVFQTFGILAFVSVSIGPGEDAVACEHSLAPLAFIGAAIGVAKCALATEVSLFEVALIHARLTDIVAIALFNSVPEVALVIRSVAELLNTFTVRLVPFPTSRVLIILIWIYVISFSLRLSILDLTLIIASVVEDISPLNCSLPCEEEPLIVRPIFEEEFPFTVEFLLLPFAMIVPLWCL